MCAYQQVSCVCIRARPPHLPPPYTHSLPHIHATLFLFWGLFFLYICFCFHGDMFFLFSFFPGIFFHLLFFFLGDLCFAAAVLGGMRFTDSVTPQIATPPSPVCLCVCARAYTILHACVRMCSLTRSRCTIMYIYMQLMWMCVCVRALACVRMCCPTRSRWTVTWCVSSCTLTWCVSSRTRILVSCPYICVRICVSLYVAKCQVDNDLLSGVPYVPNMSLMSLICPVYMSLICPPGGQWLVVRGALCP